MGCHINPGGRKMGKPFRLEIICNISARLKGSVFRIGGNFGLYFLTGVLVYVFFVVLACLQVVEILGSFSYHHAGQGQQGMSPLTISARTQMASSFKNAPLATSAIKMIR